MRLRELSRIEADAIVDFDAEFASTGQPVIISGAGKDWVATKTWSFGMFAQRFGTLKVPVRASDDEFAEFFSARARPASGRKMLGLAEYIGELEATTMAGPRPPFAGNLSLLGDPAVSPKLGVLLDDCPFPQWLDRKRTDEYRLWMGAAGQRSTIHNDPYHNFNVQILGRKRFILFAPDQHRFLYPEFFHRGMWSSPVDPADPDRERHPLFANASGFDCALEPGDILFIPRFWWHAATALKASVNVNRWTFAEDAEKAWWHQQPEARSFISYPKLRALVASQFEALDPDVKQYHRPQFEDLTADLARIMSESEGPLS